MKKLISALLVCAFLTGCAATGVPGSSDTESFFSDTQDRKTDLSVGNSVVPSVDSAESDSEVLEDLGFSSMDAPELLNYIEHEVYQDLIEDLNSDAYFIENVDAVYVSKEYAEELAYNSESNVYYGFTLAELDEVFQGTRYVFTLGDSGQTVVQEFQQYDDSYNRMIANVAIGSGVIIVCVVVSCISKAAGATAVASIFAYAAKGGAIAAVADGATSGVVSGVVTGLETKDVDKALKSAAMSASEGYKWGAIVGSVSAGAGKAASLYGATRNGLTMNQVAKIQQESKWSAETIKQIRSWDEYLVYKNAGLKEITINNQRLLLKGDIDLNYKSLRPDGTELTNLQRMEQKLAPIDPITGKAYQLHHLGQKSDGTLALLTITEHQQNYSVLNTLGKDSEIDRNAFEAFKKEFYPALAKYFKGE